MPFKQSIPTPDDLATLVDLGDRQQLRLLLNELHPVDVAENLSLMDKSHKLSCFRLLDLDHASSVLAELESIEQVELLKDLGDFGIVPMISRMSPDDAVDLLSGLPREKARSIVSQMTNLEAVENIKELMLFKEDSAGGIMSTHYLAVKDSMTVEEALTYLRDTYENVENNVYDVYVVNEEKELVGFLTLKELLTTDTNVIVKSIMEPSVIKVTTTTDQEEAANKLRRYDLLSLPVVDTQNKLRGIITADDIIDVIHEEAYEDIFQSSGINASSSDVDTERLRRSVILAFRARLPWLGCVLIIEAMSAIIIGYFDNVIKQVVVAAAFMPLLSAVTGSAAVQSTCITIREATDSSKTFKTIVASLFHELKVGALLGIVCGITIFALSLLFQTHSNILGFIIGISLFITMIFGVLMGTIVPLFFQRVGIDPAYASGPLISSLLDVFTFTIYLAIVHTFLSQICRST